ncbi:hypothetical protein [Mesorhizobium sp.]|uniref:hypothetical protein n=1 Tax=Mesorhizobium sp. TaxID=1871066 RepID=UPI001203412A|nr:hypothetical protein [Mesorhizobium sp.]TIL34326.1 MAG: hypothetical protein E5Y85_11335 [Mesorhizobium sp.]
MTITYRSVKGSNLTAAEVDDNFHDLDDRMTELEDNPPEPTNISNITVVGTQMTIYLEDATVFGPFTLPQANFRPSVVATVSAATFTPGLSDANCYKLCSNAGGCEVTLSDDADVAWLPDTEVTFDADNAAGLVSFVGGSTDVTVEPPTGFLAQTAVQGAVVTAKRIGANRWRLIGLLLEDVTA